MTNQALDTAKAGSNRAELFILSNDPNKAMQEMMETIDSLRSVYVEETEALEKADTKLFLSLQSRKVDAAQRYHDGIAQIIERREEMKNINPDLRSKLHGMQSEFTTITMKNLKALDRMNKNVKRLGERIVRAAREAAAKEGVNYGRNGNVNAYSRRVSMGLNESA